MTYVSLSKQRQDPQYNSGYLKIKPQDIGLPRSGEVDDISSVSAEKKYTSLYQQRIRSGQVQPPDIQYSQGGITSRITRPSELGLEEAPGLRSPETVGLEKPKSWLGGFFGGIGDTLKSIRGGTEKVLGLGKEALIEAPARAIASGTLSATGVKEYQPTTPIQKTFFGERPIKDIEGTGKDVISLTGQKEGQGFFGEMQPFAVGLGVSALDLWIGGGGKKKIIEKLAEETTELGVKNILKKELKNVAENELDVLARKLAPITDKKVIKSELDNFAKSVTSKADQTVQEIPLEARKAQTRTAALEGIENVTAREAFDVKQNMLAENITPQKNPTLWEKLKFALAPVKQLDKETQAIYKDFSRKKLVAKEVAEAELNKIGRDDTLEGLRTIFNYESGKYGKDWAIYQKIRPRFDKLFQEAQERGIQLSYKENYLPQVYKNKPDEVVDAMTRYMRDRGVDEDIIRMYISGQKDLSEQVAGVLRMNPSFAYHRVMPDYATAVKYGLEPKYTNVGKLLAFYREQLETTIANKEFVEKLVNTGKVLPEEIAPRSWKPIEVNFLRGYFADNKTSTMLNKLYKDPNNIGLGEGVISGIASLSRRMQEIALSAGVPKTNINFFTIGQTIKELTSGNVKVFAPFFRSISNEASTKWFVKNQNFLSMMANQGIDLGGRIGKYSRVYETFAGKKGVREITEATLKIAGEKFDKLFNEKTFASFMPQMYTQAFKDAYKKGLNKGLKEEVAQEFAGNVVRAAFGLIEDVGRAQSTQDALSAVFFAPKFREGIINTLFNTLKSVTTEIKNPAFYKNRRLLAGMTIMYGVYNALNKKFTGNYMWENESGKEFDLKIPLGNGEYTYIGFMPSFLAFARNMVSGVIATAKGDVSTAKQKFGSVLSMPIKIFTEVWANKDYFGNPIYKETDTGSQKAGKIAKYIGLEVNHPYIQGVIDAMENKKPLPQIISVALELPLKFSNEEKIQRSKFYNALDKRSKERARARERVKPIYDNVQELLLVGKQEEARGIVNNLSKEDYEVYKDIKSSDKRSQTVAGEARMYDTVERVQQLLQEGKEDDARAIVEELTKEEYRLYKLAKERLGYE